MNFAEYAQAAQLSDKQLYLRNQKNPPEARVRVRDWRHVGRDHLRNVPIRILRPSREESKGEQSTQARRRTKARGEVQRARAHLPLPLPQRGWAVWRARAPAHLPGSAPRPAARSRPRAEATQSRSPTQRRWRRQQRRGPRGCSARALRAHLPHFGHRRGCPPAGLRWRRQQRQGKRQSRAESAGGAAAPQLRIPRPWRGSLRDHGFLGLLPAWSGLEGTRLHVLLDRPFCRLRLALPSAAAAILCPGPRLRAAHALVPPLRDLAAAAPPF
ncbi:uncharacterized protein LOC130541051 [Pan paniscus]|uniref:uncharacterized protein LOC130541051 n=1 Tax=Pan paniscus TaxID=9597 RepID=UPI0025463FB2|nr:uncharacterized protein LOC130541051 [Pan paniscus]